MRQGPPSVPSRNAIQNSVLRVHARTLAALQKRNSLSGAGRDGTLHLCTRASCEFAHCLACAAPSMPSTGTPMCRGKIKRAKRMYPHSGPRLDFWRSGLVHLGKWSLLDSCQLRVVWGCYGLLAVFGFVAVRNSWLLVGALAVGCCMQTKYIYHILKRKACNLRNCKGFVVGLVHLLRELKNQVPP